jgi:release factor glutamine methyltransferase
VISPGTTIAAALAASGLDAVDARILLGHALGLSRVQLITRADLALDALQAQRIGRLFARRLNGEPVAYLTGEREFFGLSFEVGPGVLIPRPETELLVELAAQRISGALDSSDASNVSGASGASIVDLGTGSGAIAVALARAHPDCVVTALDISEDALRLARRNALRHGATVEFLRSDWYAAVAGRRFDLIVSNPPYIVAGDEHLSRGDLRFEPVDALTDHADGLAALRVIVAGAPAHLLPGGWLLMEHGYDQAGAVRALLAAAGFSRVQSWRDLAGIERASGGLL